MNPRRTKKVKKASLGLSNLSPKTMMAVALVSLMLIMWGRVLLTGKNAPKSANAATQPDTSQVQQPLLTASESKFVAVELPVLEGRNDCLTNNIFSADNWKAFEFHEKEEQPVAKVDPVVPKVDPQEQIRKLHQANLNKISERLTLEAVIHGADGKPCKAYVNDKILAVGTVLTVQEGPETYELRLTELSEKEALFQWNEFSMVLKITEMVNQ